MINQTVDAVRSADNLIVGLYGPGGFGKTTLANEVSRLTENSFPGGTLWVTLGEDMPDPVLAGKVNDLCELLSGTRPTLTDPAMAGHRLGELLDERAPVLLVIDDVWAAHHLTPFQAGGRSSLGLVTTRTKGLIPEDAAGTAGMSG